MIDGKYDVIFRGQIVKNLELTDVQANLVKLFKSSPEAVQKLFSGNEVIIRKSLDYSAAMKYQSALKGAGALALIKGVEVAEDEDMDSKAAEPHNTDSVEKVDTNGEIGTDSEDTLSVAEVGARLLPPKHYQQKEVDTSALSLGKVGERLLPKKEPKVYPQPSIDHLTLDKQ